MLDALLDGKEIITVEGLERGVNSTPPTSIHRSRRFPMRLLHTWFHFVHGALAE